jgi:hypothetical protein
MYDVVIVDDDDATILMAKRKIKKLILNDAKE